MEVENESINDYNMTRYINQTTQFFNTFKDVMANPDGK
jgi:hypothetical protein